MKLSAWRQPERVGQDVMGREIGHFFIKAKRVGRALRDVPEEAQGGEEPQSREDRSLSGILAKSNSPGFQVFRRFL